MSQALLKYGDIEMDEINGEIYTVMTYPRDKDARHNARESTESERIKKSTHTVAGKGKVDEVFVLKGNYVGPLPAHLYFLAANPSNDFYGTTAHSYNAPFPNESIAFENTPNRHLVKLDGLRHFEAAFVKPNAFYTENGSVYHPSQIYVKIIHVKNIKTTLGDKQYPHTPDIHTIPMNSATSKTQSVLIH